MDGLDDPPLPVYDGDGERVQQDFRPVQTRQKRECVVLGFGRDARGRCTRQKGVGD